MAEIYIARELDLDPTQEEKNEDDIVIIILIFFYSRGRTMIVL